MNEKLEVLLSTLIVAQANFRTLHWMSSGKKFDRQHSLSAEYEEMVSGSIDTVAEILLRYQNKVPTLSEAITKSALQLIDGGQSINYEAFNAHVGTQLSRILSCILTVLNDDNIQNDIRNVGVKADLEGLFSSYDLQFRYLHAHRVREF